MGVCKCFLRSILLTVIIVAIIVLIPNLPPYAAISKSASIPKTKPLVGPLAINEKLKDTEIWHKGQVRAPEAFAEYNGELYASLQDGVIVKFVNNQIVTVVKTGKPCKGYYEERKCGRPLGLKFDKNGILYVADAYYGILKINIKSGEKEVLVSPNTKINGKKPKLFNGIALASNGDIYWTDSSTQFHLDDLVYDFLADPSGRLVRYDAKTKKNEVLIDNLYFANGVMLSDGEEFAIVAETTYNRIHRYYLKGPKKGTRDIFIEGLPGFPDNLQSDGKDGFLAPMVEFVNEEHPSPAQMLFQFPLARKFFARLMGLSELAFETLDKYYPTEFAQKAIHFIGHYSSIVSLAPNQPYQVVVHLSKNGDILGTLSTTDKKVRKISDAFIFKDHLYLGSAINDHIGRIALAKAGLETPKIKRSVPSEVPKVETTPPPPAAKPKQDQSPPPKITTPPPPPKQAQTPTPKATTAPPPPKATSQPKQQTQPPPKATTPPPKQQTQPTTPPPKQQTPPPKQQTPPPKQQTTPPKQQTPPPKQQTPPPKQQTPPPKQQTPPPKQQTPPPNQQTPPPKQQAPPPKQQTPPPKQQTPSSKQQTPPPKQQTPPPKQQTPPPKQQTPPPKQQTPPPKQQAPSQKEQAQSTGKSNVKNEL